jgi:DNA-binding MarR family transcriptional regulator
MIRRVPEPHLSAWKALLRSHAKAIGQIEEDLVKVGAVPLTSYDVLLELSSTPNYRLRMADLAERVVLSRSGLTRLVERLEREGYLLRENTPQDRRGVEAVLTEEGLAALKAAWPVYAKGINSYFAQFLSNEEAGQLEALLGRIAAQSQ